MANQYASPKREILGLLNNARLHLTMAAEHSGDAGDHATLVRWAREEIIVARRIIDAAPASTRRRWKAGR